MDRRASPARYPNGTTLGSTHAVDGDAHRNGWTIRLYKPPSEPDVFHRETDDGRWIASGSVRSVVAGASSNTSAARHIPRKKSTNLKVVAHAAAQRFD
jgi:hypothetical protein